MKSKTERRDDALDVLKGEDQNLVELFEQFFGSTGSGVTARTRHGNLGKQLIRRMAVREAARDHLADALVTTTLSDVSRRFFQDTTRRRQAIDHIEDMSRGIQGLYLNTHQDFDGAVADLCDIVKPEIAWELESAIPLVESAIPAEHRTRIFRSARYIRKHAPITLNPEGPKWYEHSGIISRFLTIWGHLRSLPRANPSQRV